VFFILAAMRHGLFQPMLFVFPVTYCRNCYRSHQGRPRGNVKNGERKDQDSGDKERDNRYRPRVLDDVSENKKQQCRWDHREATMNGVDEAEAMPEDEARSAKQKHRTSGYNYDPRPPRDVS
jgi:hypothetical protein